MIKEYLENISEGNNLSLDEAHKVMQYIMNGECNNSLISGLLLALKTKGETPEEVAGFVKAMREISLKVKSQSKNTIDVCGTGGDGSNSFNISTVTAFVVAGAGVYVAKHGNRSVSSKSGSADVLTRLGVNINLKPELTEHALNEVGIAFLFAPVYHPAMKFAADVRRDLGIKTIFNILGPLTNPAGTKKQLVGVFSNKAAKLMAEAVNHLEMERIIFLSTENCFDEISLSGVTNIYEYNSGVPLKEYKVDCSTFSLSEIDPQEIKSDSIETNAEIFLSILRDKNKDEAFSVVAANAAMALYVAGLSDNLVECKNIAEESILSGRAFEKFISLKNFGEKYS
ncbi:MAG: anthranilate phosphoribosyltransferase [Ignavibacteria bacterium]|nr:MAG: anthranilate phosphoribosyltransferase [Ignavibacteria bacterium]KAF0161974.1 MAG: anthranilate phosphoribosyltransferase [Ignavibacteria bacterium]